MIVATWNVFNGTAADAIGEQLVESAGEGVSLWLLQELVHHAQREAVREAGLRLFRSTDRGEAIAWKPDAWRAVHGRHVRLAKTTYFTAAGGREQIVDAPALILSDMRGRTLEALSYHLAPHVQVANPPARRIQSSREAMRTLGQLADASQTRAILYGGDDNVDEPRAFSDRWDFMRRAATGLRQVQAPAGTHGGKHGRRLDDFRVRGLKPGTGRVVDTASDHRMHVRHFSWKG